MKIEPRGGTHEDTNRQYVRVCIIHIYFYFEDRR